jgi:signal transduction histidine kinase
MVPAMISAGMVSIVDAVILKDAFTSYDIAQDCLEQVNGYESYGVYLKGLDKTRQMNLLVTDLFTAALDDLGELTVNCTDESSTVLYDIVLANDPRSLAVQTDIPECLISIDRSRMSQIVGNIIGNSYKYADTPIDISY